MFHKIKLVKPQEDFMLCITFENGETGYYDIKPLFDRWEVFRDLKNIAGLYQQVKTDQGGYGISWNDDIDLSCEELWLHCSKEECNI